MNPENLKFPKKTLSPQQRERISMALSKKRPGVALSLMHRVFQLSVTLVLLIGVGIFSLFFISGEKGEDARNGGSNYNIELPDGIVSERSGNTLIFKQGERTVGGAAPTTPEEKQSLESGPGIFEKKEINDLKYPAERILEHVKTMTATQTYHYFVQTDEKTWVRVFFHTPYLTEEQAAEAMRTFSIE
ncbi:hypothetical protein RFW18_12560 [Metabacillus idriensis]|uniref:hypothetical protein n=1 Tax=Metabacillus idriensis TaxID=324768 RepID=UPI00281334B4|nr:hypothetical protein [Metabacillus idriensis]MDR0138579.1 hypothetical protein [Metabacillus idriensis]